MSDEPALSDYKNGERPASNSENTNVDTDQPVYLQSSEKITAKFLEEHNPDYIYSLVSGGGDSDTACVVAQEFGIELSGVVHVNTGTGIEETRRYVMGRCLDWDLPYHELTSLEDADQKRQTEGLSTHERINADRRPYADLDSYYHGVRRPNDDYEKLVRKMGFPGPSMHWIMYLALKHKPIKNFVKQHHDEDETVAFISGVRKNESDRRAKNLSDDVISENWDGCTVVSPLANWSKTDVSTFRTNRNLPSNSVSDILGMSGECLCGAYGSREELEKIKRWGYTDAARFIENLELEVYDTQISKGYVAEEYGLWGHGNSQDPDAYDREKPQMLLCADCDNTCEPAVMSKGKDESTSPAETAMNKNAHCEMDDRWFFCPDCMAIFDDPIEHRKEVHAITPEPPYSGHIPWDIREVNNNKTKDGFAIKTDPKLTKQQRMENATGQQVGCLGECQFESTEQEGVNHCPECGKYEIETEALEHLMAGSTDGKPVEDLIELEPGVLSDLIPSKHIDETDVITTKDELRAVTTADEIVDLLVERLNSLSEYLETDPTFERVINDAGLESLINTLGVRPSDILDRNYHSNILTALKSEAKDEGNTKPLQAEFDPRQQEMESFSTKEGLNG